jgi:hypothetical protein
MLLVHGIELVVIVAAELGTFFFLIFEIFFMAFLCVSQQGEFKNTIKNFLEKIHVKNFWPKKLREKKTFFLSSFPVDFFLSRFWPFLCMRRSSKTPQKLFGENPKKLREKKTFFFFPFVFSRRFLF